MRKAVDDHTDAIKWYSVRLSYARTRGKKKKKFRWPLHRVRKRYYREMGVHAWPAEQPKLRRRQAIRLSLGEGAAAAGVAAVKSISETGLYSLVGGLDGALVPCFVWRTARRTIGPSRPYGIRPRPLTCPGRPGRSTGRVWWKLTLQIRRSPSEFCSTLKLVGRNTKGAEVRTPPLLSSCSELLLIPHA